MMDGVPELPKNLEPHNPAKDEWPVSDEQLELDLEAYFVSIQEKISLLEKREAEPEIKIFNEMVAAFEQKHSLSELHKINEVSDNLLAVFEFSKYISLTDDELKEQLEKDFKDLQGSPEFIKNQTNRINNARQITLSYEDKQRFEVRIAAKGDLDSIVAMLNILEKETNISNENFLELKEKYKILSRAVGVITGSTVYHTKG